MTDRSRSFASEADARAWIANPDTAPSPAPPAGALRDQIAEAVYEYNNPGFRWADAHPDDRAAYSADAAAALPVIEQHTAQLRTRAEKAEADLRRVSALHADTERQLRDDLAAEVRKREAAEATARTLGATVTRVHEHVQNLDQMAESTASASDRRLYQALADDLRKRLGYDTNDTPKGT